MKTRNVSICDFITEFFFSFGYIKFNKTKEEKQAERFNGGYMYAVFNDNLLTGNKLIDEQHKEIIDKINKLVVTCENGSCQIESVKMLDYLADYTEEHFQAEEELQKEVGYPGLEEHKKRHDEFRVAVKELHEMLEEEEGPSPRFVAAVQEHVVDWLYRHIKGFDCSVATFINLKSLPERL